MEAGKECKLSSLRIGDIGKLNGNEFIVTERLPEDRRSGETRIKYRDDLGDDEFYWDSLDPAVIYLRKGKIIYDWND